MRRRQQAWRMPEPEPFGMRELVTWRIVIAAPIAAVIVYVLLYGFLTVCRS